MSANYTRAIFRVFIGFFILVFSLTLGFSLAYAASWPMFRQDLLHSGNSLEKFIGPPLSVKWAFSTGGNIWSSPSVVDDLVYVGSSDNKVYALNTQNGQLEWEYKAQDGIYSSPAVVDETLYIGSFDHKVYALDAFSGERIWEYETDGSIYSSPTVLNDIVYVGSFDHKVYALDTLTGTPQWEYKTGGEIYSSPAIAEGILYIGSADKNIYAIDIKTGELKWSYETGDHVSSSPAVINGILYVGSGDGKIYALNALTGKLKWSYQTGKGVFSSPAVAKNTVFVGSYDGNVYALNAKNGKLVWKFTVKDGVYHSSPAVANGVVYIGLGYRNRIHAFDAKTGSLLWTYPTGASVGSSPAIVNGTLFIAASDGKVYAFGDTNPPVAKVNKLKAFQKEDKFEVLWSGDDRGGSGIKHYDVQYREGTGGEWENWFVETAKEKSEFGPFEPIEIAAGQSYYFRCRAADFAGNWSNYVPGNGDAHTTIDAQPPAISTVTFDGEVVESGDAISTKPKIEIAITDNVEVDPRSITIKIDKISYRPQKFSGGVAVYKHDYPLSTGNHRLEVSAQDIAGNIAETLVFEDIIVMKGVNATNVAASPNPFNPLAGPTYISYNLNADVAVDIFVYDQRNTLIDGIKCQKSESGGKNGANKVAWKGILGSSSVAMNGTYTFKLVANKNLLGEGRIEIKR